MGTTFASTASLIPMILSLAGVLAALQYLKGMADFSAAIKFIFFGFLFVLLTKILILSSGFISTEKYYFLSLLFHLWSAILLTAGASSIRGGKFFSRTIIIFACLLAAVWSWYVVIITRDGSMLTVSLAAPVVGYAFLSASLWRRKTLRNSIGFVITGWFSIFLALYNLLTLMSWGQSLLSTAFETFLYIAIMCGWVLISNNLMAHQFDMLEQEAEESKERLRLMIQMSPFPIIISRLKDDQLMLINNKAGALFGLDVKHPGNFKTVDYFAEPSKRTELLAKLEKHPVVDDFEFLVKPRRGEPFWLLLSARVIDFEYEIALYMAFQDITDRKKKELQLFDQATKDPLTKCYNRRQFEELAKNEIQRSRRYNHPFCLFMIDADHFKNVNDTHGHAVGDLVLQALADCCRRTLRESDIIARFGGEEFVILLPEITIENAHRVTERLRIKISKLVVKNEQNQDVQFTVSIGLVSSTITDDIPEMLKMADESLYVAKENGRNRVVVYEADGPNKDLPPPESEEIEKAKEESLYYFSPSGTPIVTNNPILDEPDTNDDNLFVPTNKPVAPPIALDSPIQNDEEFSNDGFSSIDPEFFKDDTQNVSEVEDSEEYEESSSENETDFDAPSLPIQPPDADEDLLVDDGDDQILSEDSFQEEQILIDDERLGFLGEKNFAPPSSIPTDDSPISQEDQDFSAADDNNSEFETANIPLPPPTIMPPPRSMPGIPAPEVKAPVLKKMPIKMPPGMVKIPKMPGIVRVKIPKTMQQVKAPILPPKPEQK